LELRAREYSRPSAAWRLLQLHNRRTGNQTRALDSSQGRRPQPPSSSHVPRGLPCGSGKHAARRATSARDDLGAGSSHLRGFARPRYHPDRATSCDLRRMSVVTIDVHGPLDRVKDVSPDRDRHGGRSRRVRALGARRQRSPPQHPKSIRCRRRALSRGKRPSRTRRTGQDSRSYDAPRRAPPSGESGCLSPSRRQARERIAPSGFLRRPLAHAAHTFSTKWGEVLSRGIASVLRGASSAEDFERASTFTTRWKTRAWA